MDILQDIRLFKVHTCKNINTNVNRECFKKTFIPLNNIGTCL